MREPEEGPRVVAKEGTREEVGALPSTHGEARTREGPFA